MSLPPPPTVDLTNCDREPIHLLGAIQPFGFLIGVSADWIITRLSANAPDYLKQPIGDLLGLPIVEVLTEEGVHTIRGRLQVLRGADAVERIFNLRLLDSPKLYDVAVHVSEHTIVIEAEPSPADANMSASSVMRSMLGRLHQVASFEDFCRDAARQLRAFTGFDRVMIYRFAADKSGEVIAEAARSHLEPYLGLHYPASDIPAQARILYERNWLRVIGDTEAEPVPIVPQLDPHKQALDLSLSVLRSVSPIHIEYLRNMGVRASMSVSILRGGKLWGLFACHHMGPHHLSFDKRTAAELFGQMFSLMLEARERERDQQMELQAREVHQRLMSAMAAEKSPFDNIGALIEDFRSLIPCDGIGVWLNGDAKLVGQTPTRDEFAQVVRFLNRAAASRIYETHHIGEVHAPGADFAPRAAGLLAIPISRRPRDYLVFFRQEVSRTVTWAGNPDKPSQLGPNGVRLTPRKSFEAWREVVQGQSERWTDVDLRVAESLRVSLLEVILRLTDYAERERKSTQERQELLIAELNHRVRNILGLIKGLIAQSRNAKTVEEFAEIVSGRVHALARAHDQITSDNWQHAPLRALILAEAGAYFTDAGARVKMSGPPVLLEPQAFTTFALVFHELFTNSAKYGALCDQTGHVTIDWSFDEDKNLTVIWREHNGPPVKPPTRRGFGTTIIEKSVPHELKGEAEIDFALTGVTARYLVPAMFVTEAEADDVLAEQAALMPETTPLGGLALVVEDNMIIALDAEEMLSTLGASRVDQAASVSEALRILGAVKPDFAMLDFNLGIENSLPVALRLRELGVPFIFTTGYGDQLKLPPELQGTPVTRKPFTPQSLRIAIAALKGDET